MIDRLSLNPDRIEAMAEGLRQVAELHDPIGSVEHMQKTPNGLLIGKKTVPLGVVGIIYESRPNVTAEMHLHYVLKQEMHAFFVVEVMRSIQILRSQM